MKATTENAWALMEELKDIVGAEEQLDALARALGTFKLADNLEYICRMWDFDWEEDDE